MHELSPNSRQLLRNIEHYQRTIKDEKPETIHVSGVASTVYFAYEQLRNAAGYSHQHLLLRASIERYLRRNIFMPHHSDKPIKKGEDLIIELTHARYLINDTVPERVVGQIDDFINQYVKFYDQLVHQAKVPANKASKWIFQLLSVSIERLVSPKALTDYFIDFAYNHYLDSVDPADFGVGHDQFKPCLYFALHRTILNSDIATVRAYWLSLNWQKQNSAFTFAKECELVDTYFEHAITNRVTRLINRNGAPMKILHQIITDDKNFEWLSNQPHQLLAKIEEKLIIQYGLVQDKLIGGIIRAVAFIFVTKMVFGIGVEIPYDLTKYGYVDPTPLLINLVFPPLYMASAIVGIRRPSPQNTTAVVNFAERIVYKTNEPIKYKIKKRTAESTPLSTAFNIIYTIAFLVSMTALTWLLLRLNFTWVHIVIFFVFFSGVSFLRFRLITASRELEIIDPPQTLFGVFAEFFYTPFIHLGHWLSDKYQRLNLMTFLLDLIIETPLKTVLRILRQWVGFVRDKREEI